MTLSRRVRRLRAPNPSPMTLDGTNGYIVDGGDGTWIAIDPGPDHPAHIAAFVDAARAAGARFTGILVTHGHPDHFPGAAPLARATGAPVYAHPAARFAHDRTLAEGNRIAAGDATLLAIEAPGHARDHLVFVLEDERALFTGDVIIGRGTVVIAPPGGDMRVYQHTLARLRAEFGSARAIYGGHGAEIRDVRAKIDEYIAHRAARETEIVAALGVAARTIPALVTSIYSDVDARLWPAAARQVLAYLIALEREGHVLTRSCDREPTPDERAMLEPNLGAIVHPEIVAVVRAELGFTDDPQPLVEYRLAS